MAWPAMMLPPPNCINSHDQRGRSTAIAGGGLGDCEGNGRSNSNAPLPATKKRRRGGGGGGVKEEHDMIEPLSGSKGSFSDEGNQPEHQGGAGGGSGEGRTCISCRKSKVKCSRGLPCDRCSRLKLVCIAQVRGRGRPVASSTAAKKSLKQEQDGTTKVDDTDWGSVTDENMTVAGPGSGHAGGSSNICDSNSSSGSRGSSGVLSAAHSSRAGGAANTDNGRSSSGRALGSRNGSSSTLGFSSSIGVLPSPAAAPPGALSPTPPFGYAAPMCGGGSSRADSGGDGGRVEVGCQLAHHAQLQHLDTCSRSFLPGLTSSGLPLSSAAAAAAAHQPPQQQQQQQSVQGDFHGTARPFFHPLLHGGGGGGGSGSGLGGGGGVAINAPVSGPINSGSSWRGMFLGNDGSSAGIASAGSSAGGSGEDSRDDIANAANGQWEYMSAPSVAPARVNGEADTSPASSTEGFLSAPLGHRANVGRCAGDGRGESGRCGDGDGGGGGGGISMGKGKGSSSLSSDGGFHEGRVLAPMWVEMMDEHTHAVAATDPTSAAAAAGEGGNVACSRSPDREIYSSKSDDKQARWLLDVEQGADDSGADSEDRSPEANGGAIDATDAIVSGFWKLFSEQEVHRPKAVLVIRHWALCALDRRSTHLMRETVSMARALSINVAEILNDYSIYAMFHELLREAEAGNTIEPVPPAKVGHQEAPPYIEELSSKFAAVSMRVVLRGQSSFYHNDVCSRLFLSTEVANEMYASDKQDVWATCIHPDDHKAFFDNISMELFRSPGHQSEFKKIFKCRDRAGAVFLALVHFRYEFRDDGNYAAFGLSMLPLPQSDYIQKVDQPSAVENGHGGDGAAASSLRVQPQPLPPPSSSSKPPPPQQQQRPVHQSSGSGGHGTGEPVTAAAAAAAAAAAVGPTLCCVSSPRDSVSSAAPLQQRPVHQSSGSGSHGTGEPVTAAAAAAAAVGPTLCCVSSARDSVSSAAPSSVLAAVAAAAPGREEGDGDGSCMLLHQPLPSLDLDATQWRAGLFGHGSGVDSADAPSGVGARVEEGGGPPRSNGFGFSSRLSCSSSGGGKGAEVGAGRSRGAWGSHEAATGAPAATAEMAGPAELEDDSFSSSRGSVSGMMFHVHNGGGGGFQTGELGSVGLEPGSSRGGVSSGWIRTSSDGEMRMVDGL